MRRRIIGFLASFLIVVTGGAVIATPAQAQSCPGGYICFYNNANGTGLMDQILVREIQRTVCRRLPTLATNRTSYISNRSAEVFFVYDGGYCSDTPGRINPNSSGPMTGRWNDSISSYFKA